MLDKLIIIKDDKDYQCSTFEEIVKYLINENYYNLTKQEKENIMMKKAIEKARTICIF